MSPLQAHKHFQNLKNEKYLYLKETMRDLSSYTYHTYYVIKNYLESLNVIYLEFLLRTCY